MKVHKIAFHGEQNDIFIEIRVDWLYFDLILNIQCAVLG